MNDIGFLYVISDGNKVKIGKSKTPKDRTDSLVSICGIKNPKVFISEECSLVSNKETKCHKYFSRLKVCGEWFSTSFNDAVDAVRMIAGSEDLTVKKQQDSEEYYKRLAIIGSSATELAGMYMEGRNCSNYNFELLFRDTIELIDICEDELLINRLMDVNGSLEKLLIVRCEALFDVINQQRKLLDFKQGVDNES